jgi:hypothetical protein
VKILNKILILLFLASSCFSTLSEIQEINGAILQPNREQLLQLRDSLSQEDIVTIIYFPKESHHWHLLKIDSEILTVFEMKQLVQSFGLEIVHKWMMKGFSFYQNEGELLQEMQDFKEIWGNSARLEGVLANQEGPQIAIPYFAIGFKVKGACPLQFQRPE